MKKFTVWIFICYLIHLTNSLYCFWNTGCPYKYLSTETPYNSVRGDIRDSIVKLKGCEPVSIWGIFRHGKIRPSTQLAENMKEAISIRNYVVSSYEKGRSSLCAQDVENLRTWKFNSNFFDGSQDITEEGRKEMTGLGKRLREAFPQLLNKLQKGSYSLRSAKGSWIEKSIQYFVSGLNDSTLVIDDVKLDDVMDPYVTCVSHQENVQKNPNMYAVVNKYLSTPDYLATKDRIQRRSGIEYHMTDENITSLYDLCRSTWSAVDGKISPWCALFTTDDLQVLEYIQDLRHYYRNGYGAPANEVFGRVPLSDLLKSFEDVVNGGGKRIVTYVTYATMLDQIYTALGLFKDTEPLTAENRDRERKWRTSKISVFSANLLAVLNRCDKAEPEDYNVVFYLNEEPMGSICEEGVCSWREFQNKLRPFTNSSNNICEYPNEQY